jgi:CMP-N,N'-diacetyllegionaminic acid synthase
MSLEISAVIVARGGSIRVPGKNLKPLNGISLLGRKIKNLKESKKIDRIIVGSEDDYILEEALKYGAEVIRRPKEYCDERIASANDMIGNMCKLIETDIVVWAHCTNPLVTGDIYDKAIDSFYAGLDDNYDSLLSVYEVKEHFWDSKGSVLNYNPYQKRHTLASELEPIYAQDGAIFIQKHKQMLSNSYFFGKSPKLFIMPDGLSLDINTEFDFEVADAIFSKLEATS